MAVSSSTETNLSRTKNLHVNFLDTMRGAAVIIVFLFHALGTAFPYSELPWGQWFRQFNGDFAFLTLLPISFGWTGVAIFFVISGFCIHLSFVKTIAKLPPKIPKIIERSLINQVVQDFYWRRFWRIYPPYGVALVLFALVFPLTKLSWSNNQDLWEFISHIFLFHNFDADLFLKINPSFWSIAVEMQLYLLYPLLWAGSQRWGWGKMLTWLTIIEITCRILDGLHLTVWDSRLSLLISCAPWIHFLSWGIGAYLAELFWRRRLNIATFPLLKTRSSYWLAAAIICYTIKPLSAFTFLLCSLGTATYIAHRLYQSSSNQLFLNKLDKNLNRFSQYLQNSQLWQKIYQFCQQHLITAGILSYSIYLLHQPILLAVAQLLRLLPANWISPWLLFIGCCLSWHLIILIGEKFYYFVEMPSIKLGKNLAKLWQRNMSSL
ncbi:MAG: acyltransferase family protein [Pseudanabaenaceae cyanobacterium]|jgi:peptidoglycan/LPS O-acetylase OafA/YrhL